MADEPLTYAKAGGPPADWLGIAILDRDSGQFVEDVEECNAAEGWLIRHKRNARGEFYLDGDKIAKERIEGRFAILRRRAS